MQKLTRLLVGSAVLATVALSAPETALAAPSDGITKPDRAWDQFAIPVKLDGKYTRGSTIYHLPRNSPALINPQNWDGPLCVQLRDAHSELPLAKNPTCYNAGETGSKPLIDQASTDAHDVVLYAQEPLGANKNKDDQDKIVEGWLIHG